MITNPFQLYIMFFGQNSAKKSISKNKEEYSVTSSLFLGEKKLSNFEGICPLLGKFCKTFTRFLVFGATFC
jgi:hypothetical protein